MYDDQPRPQSRRRTRRRYFVLMALVLAAIAGWSWFWKYAAAKAEVAVEGWRAREARAGRIYKCGSQSIGGFPFRIEVNCDAASVEFRSNQPPVEVKTGGVLVVAQIYQPNFLISEFQAPLTIADLGQAPKVVANWKLGQSSVRGAPRSPERVSVVFDEPVINLVSDNHETDLLRAKRVELHGRIAEGSAADNPVIEVMLRFAQVSAPAFNSATVQPVDAEITGVLRGLGDFSPKHWAQRLRELQARGGRIDITQARIAQGDTIASGNGSLSIDSNGQLDGELSITVAGLEPFLVSIGAQQAVQKSPNMDKLVGMLDRLSPGLGEVARQQAGANLSLGINMLGKPATLEGRHAITLPLRFKDGAAYLGPIPLGSTPALF